MKQAITTVFFLFAALLIAGFHPAHAVDEAAKTPLAVVAQPEFQFDPVVEGVEVVHDFVVKNDGKAPLEIINVRPG
jgi:hypothetical protein